MSTTDLPSIWKFKSVGLAAKIFWVRRKSSRKKSYRDNHFQFSPEHTPFLKSQLSDPAMYTSRLETNKNRIFATRMVFYYLASQTLYDKGELGRSKQYFRIVGHAVQKYQKKNWEIKKPSTREGFCLDEKDNYSLPFIFFFKSAKASKSPKVVLSLLDAATFSAAFFILERSCSLNNAV